MQILNSILRAGFKYSKAGVMLSDFYYNDARQLDMFNVVPDDRRSRSLMTVIDKINHSEKGSVFFTGKELKNVGRCSAAVFHQSTLLGGRISRLYVNNILKAAGSCDLLHA